MIPSVPISIIQTANVIQNLKENLSQETVILKYKGKNIKVRDGIFYCPDITLYRMRSLERGDLKKEDVKSIVLHQTNGAYALSTLGRYMMNEMISPLHRALPKDTQHENSLIFRIFAKYGEGNGAHFLITPSGRIFQTASVEKICYHVGYIRARCMKTATCSVEETKIYQTLYDKEKMHLESKDPKDQEDVKVWSQIYKMESSKPSNKRYPINRDSIGIEVVGMPKDGEHYPKPNPKQNAASIWLVGLLLEYFHLQRSDVYSHGQIGPHKKPSEGSSVDF